MSMIIERPGKAGVAHRDVVGYLSVRRAYVPILLVLFVGITLSIALYAVADEWQEQRVRGRFEEEVDNIVSHLEKSLSSNEEVLASIAGLFAASYSVERHEFGAFAKGALSRHPELQALEWVPVVADSQRTAYEEAARVDGYPGFQFTERDSQWRLQRAGERQEYFPVYYVEPIVGNEIALGFNLGANPNRLEALERARDSGTFAATSRVRLIQEPGEQLGILVFMPIYRSGAPQSTVEERRAALTGFASGVFRIGDFIERSLGLLDASPYAIRLSDMDAPEEQQLLYESRDTDGDERNREQAASGLYETVRIEVGGRQWSLLVFPKDGHLRDQEIPVAPGALAAGLLMTFALAVYVGIALRHRYELSRAIAALMAEISERQRADEASRESEERYRTLVETSPDAIMLGDLEARIRYCNRQAAILLGYQNAAELLGRSALELVEGADCQGIIDEWKAGLEEIGPVANTERNLIRRDGTLVPVEISSSLMLDGKGKPSGFFALVRDITERKQAEEVFRTVYDNSPVCIYIVQDGKLQFINPQILKQTGYSETELLNMECFEFVVPQDRSAVRANAVAMLKGKKRSPYEYRMVNKSGETRWVLETVTPVCFKGERVVLGEFIDITERRMAEEAVWKSEKRFRAIFESTGVGIRLGDDQGYAVESNRAYQRMLGYSAEELRSMSFIDVTHPADVGTNVRLFEELRAGKRDAYQMEKRYIRKDGAVMWGRLTASIIPGFDDERELSLALVEDITEQKHAEEDARRWRQDWENIFQSINDPVLILDLDHRVIEANRAVMNALGKPSVEVIGKRCYELFHGTNHPPESCPMKKLLESKRGERSVMQVEHLDGSFLVSCTPVLDAEGAVERVIHVATDITARIRAQEELRESFEKLQVSLEGTIGAMALTVETRDPYTAGHQRRVAELAIAIAEEMGLPQEEIRAVRMAGLIHDIGKISVPAEILSKPGRISEFEFSLIKGHPKIAYDILSTIDFPWPIADIVLQHHERLDGSGYPSGLKGETILRDARILAVADVVEAMASHRPYRPALGIDKALEEISRKSGILYDPDAVDACLRLFGEKGFRLKQEAEQTTVSARQFAHSA